MKPKYANPQGADRWSGRGRAPSWVMELCTKEGIDLADFKKIHGSLQISTEGPNWLIRNRSSPTNARLGLNTLKMVV